MTKTNIICTIILIVFLFAPPAGSATPQSADRPVADLIIVNGNVVTMDDTRPRAEAVAVREGVILAVGGNEEVAALKEKGARTLNIEGATLMPGFIEGHGHLLYMGRSLRELTLSDAATWSDVVEKVEAAAGRTQPGEWIVGSGWHQEKWAKQPDSTVEGYPVHDDLTHRTPENPVLLYHASGHAAIANEKAMAAAGIDSDATSPAGGRIVRDENGRPTGVLLDAAIGPVRHALERTREKEDPQRREERLRRTVEKAIDHALSKGITSFQDAGSSFETIDLLKRMAEEGRLRMRLWVMVNEPNEELEKRLPDYRIDGAGGGRLTVRAVKRFMDGALGSRTAWLLEPYTDAPGDTGLTVTPPSVIEKTGRIALEHGFQLCVHAIGDRANRETLDLYERVFKGRDLPTDLRWRIEHAQHIHPDDVGRFGRLGVIASMQPVHCTSDGPWVIDRIGRQRAEEGAYVWRKLIDSGARVASGTDVPVEKVDPIANIHAAVTRRLPDGSVFFPDQKMTREEALKSYTVVNAYASFEEELKGSISPGKYADFTVLSQDLTAVPEEKIPETRVLYTIVGGVVEYAYDSR